jgi:hypothetical protein
MAFGKSAKLPRELCGVPGVNSYEINHGKPGGLGFSRVELKSQFDKQNNNPGPNSYQLETDVSKRTRGTKFVQGGSRTPYGPDRPPIPGPNSYSVNHGYVPKLLRKQQSASFRSASRRDSEFSKMGVGPGIGKYVLPTLNDWSKEPNTNPEIHTFGPIKDRFANSFQGPLAVYAAVPGPGQYNTIGMSPFALKPKTAPGSKRSKYLGKQNEIGNKPHTFGADKDRFKDSVYGRLDLIALAPGVGAYNL